MESRSANITHIEVGILTVRMGREWQLLAESTSSQEFDEGLGSGESFYLLFGGMVWVFVFPTLRS